MAMNAPRQRTSWQLQHEIIEAAQERGWEVLRYDVRAGVTIEEPRAGGVILTLSGRGATPEFIRTLPEATMPGELPSGTQGMIP